MAIKEEPKELTNDEDNPDAAFNQQRIVHSETTGTTASTVPQIFTGVQCSSSTRVIVHPAANICTVDDASGDIWKAAPFAVNSLFPYPIQPVRETYIGSDVNAEFLKLFSPPSKYRTRPPTKDSTIGFGSPRSVRTGSPTGGSLQNTQQAHVVSDTDALVHSAASAGHSNLSAISGDVRRSGRVSSYFQEQEQTDSVSSVGAESSHGLPSSASSSMQSRGTQHLDYAKSTASYEKIPQSWAINNNDAFARNGSFTASEGVNAASEPITTRSPALTQTNTLQSQVAAPGVVRSADVCQADSSNSFHQEGASATERFCRRPSPMANNMQAMVACAYSEKAITPSAETSAKRREAVTDAATSPVQWPTFTGRNSLQTEDHFQPCRTVVEDATGPYENVNAWTALNDLEILIQSRRQMMRQECERSQTCKVSIDDFTGSKKLDSRDVTNAPCHYADVWAPLDKLDVLLKSNNQVVLSASSAKPVIVITVEQSCQAYTNSFSSSTVSSKELLESPRTAEKSVEEGRLLDENSPTSKQIPTCAVFTPDNIAARCFNAVKLPPTVASNNSDDCLSSNRKTEFFDKLAMQRVNKPGTSRCDSILTSGRPVDSNSQSILRNNEEEHEIGSASLQTAQTVNFQTAEINQKSRSDENQCFSENSLAKFSGAGQGDVMPLDAPSEFTSFTLVCDEGWRYRTNYEVANLDAECSKGNINGIDDGNGADFAERISITESLEQPVGKMNGFHKNMETDFLNSGSGDSESDLFSPDASPAYENLSAKRHELIQRPQRVQKFNSTPLNCELNPVHCDAELELYETCHQVPDIDADQLHCSQKPKLCVIT